MTSTTFQSTELPRSAYELPKTVRFSSLAVVLVFFAIFPLLFTNPTVSSVGVWAMVFVMCVSGWNIFSGYTGYIALGHAVFYGVGQYATALLMLHMNITPGWPSFILIPISGVIAAIFAIPIGWMLLRVRKHTFIVLTIAMMFIFQLLAYNWSSITQGSTGLQPAQPLWAGDTFNNPFYYVAFAGAILAILTSWIVRRSKFGLNLLAIRDDEDRARSLGINTARSKLIAFVISAVFLGFAGSVYALFVGQVFPQFAFDPSFDVSLTVMAFAGGIGTIAGPAIGALVVSSAQQYFYITYGGQNVFLIVYGILFIALLRLLPGGVVPAIAGRWRNFVSSRSNVRDPHHDEPPPTADVAHVATGAEGGSN